ncbi:MAG: hypothetical protein LBQ52_01265 [Helicobacteraceae bacterium]|jgi:death-on-curing protein|nr:hypothetical protein [Helicobacteraceae bacterium]
MIGLKTEQIVMLHDELIKEAGGLCGLRDIALLESALFAPAAFYGGIVAYPTIEAKAARLAFGLIKTALLLTETNERVFLLC